jgi:CDGSH-type Zn-finger protein/uncharacterized Fe-S cluster protein YjdI
MAAQPWLARIQRFRPSIHKRKEGGRVAQIEEYRGQHVVVRFDGHKCIHSRNCVLGRPDVFVPNAEGRWIKPDNASSEAIAAIAWSCPSGAITYERLDGGDNETAPVVNVVRVRENGPLAFHADLAIEGQERAFRATLCRCGASQRKPFCDGSHAAAAFTASGEPATGESTTLAVRNGTLAVKPLRNGPLMVKGPLEVVSGTGRTVTRATENFFCRCGASSKKPFCDGTHKKIGFTADGGSKSA